MRASLFVPDREAVLEPVGGEKAWNKAAAVYVEFGDLGAVNGYQLVSILDDREETVDEESSGCSVKWASSPAGRDAASGSKSSRAAA